MSGSKYSNYLRLYQKSDKTNELFLADGQTDKHTDNGDFITLSIDWGPTIKVALSFPEFISTHQKPVYSINFFLRYS